MTTIQAPLPTEPRPDEMGARPATVQEKSLYELCESFSKEDFNDLWLYFTWNQDELRDTQSIEQGVLRWGKEGNDSSLDSKNHYSMNSKSGEWFLDGCEVVGDQDLDTALAYIAWYDESILQAVPHNEDTRLLDLAEMSEDMVKFENNHYMHDQLAIPPESRPVNTEDLDIITKDNKAWVMYSIDVIGEKYTTGSCDFGKIFIDNSFVENIMLPYWCVKENRYLSPSELSEKVKFPYFGCVKWMGPHCQLPWRLQ
ncbi:MAG: hypothetical protein CMG46_00615 [Candidatus Marinimicrobia bacterium]|nr:hypothetical protein [Candidatus Neomarinimicrobiota bacterium]|tara:strand:+ start:2595 stop:3359 length:765 start_codon:yes stop_codon:yes gene_type:complete